MDRTTENKLFILCKLILRKLCNMQFLDIRPIGRYEDLIIMKRINSDTGKKSKELEIPYSTEALARDYPKWMSFLLFLDHLGRIIFQALGD